MRKLTLRTTLHTIPGLPDYLAGLLHARGIIDAGAAAAFLHPIREHLPDPFGFADMEKAVSLVKAAKDQGKKVVVYGDYDADGVCASAILLEALETMGLAAFSYIPQRQTEGYGLHAEAINILAGQAGLLITVDCGITAIDEVRLAKDLGMQVIVTDHHAIQGQLPPADAILHPHFSSYPNEALCGAAVAWQLARALVGEKANKSLELAALATIADMVPLLGANRVIVSLGLQQMSKLLRPGLRALVKTAGIKTEQLSAEQVAFQLAPRLNAGGRLSTAQDALSLLLTRNQEEADILSLALDGFNRERRAVEQQVIKEAGNQLIGQDLSLLRSLVILGEDWNPGVVGLAAGRLAERWNYPTVVLTSRDGELTGSGRSAGGVDLFLALSQCSRLFSRFGGHAMAAGLSLQRENLDTFRKCFDRAVRQQLGDNDLIPQTAYDGQLTLSQVSLDTAQLVEKLAPFGIGNPKPQFLLDKVKAISTRGVGSEGAHLKLTIAGDKVVREGIAFSQGQLAGKLNGDLRLVASVDENQFGGKSTAQLMVKTILQSPGSLKSDQRLEAASLLLGLMSTAEEGSLPKVSRRKKIPLPKGTRGTLMVAHLADTANLAQQTCPDLHIHMQHAADPRAFHCIVYAPDWQKPFAHFESLVFLDGAPRPGVLQAAIAATGATSVVALPDNPSINESLRSFVPAIDQLRQAYVSLRKGYTNLFPDQPGLELAALLILRQLNLIDLDDTLLFAGLLPMTQVDPEQSQLYRTLTAL